MRTIGLKTLMAAAALALACAGQGATAAPQDPATAPAPAAADPMAANPPATTTAPAIADPERAATTNPTTAAAPQTAAPADPTLAQNGAPAMAPTPGIGMPMPDRIGIQPQVTENGRMAHWFHDVILLPLIVLVCVVVLALLAWAMFRFRASANPTPSKTSHNTLVEVIWTLAPVAILVAIAIPSIRLLAAQFKPAPAGAVTLKATGNQWYWTHEYPDHGGIQLTSNMLKERDEVGPGQRFRTDADGPRLLAVDNRVVLPVGVPIRLQTTGADVIHSWAIPAFWMKLDAIPGRLNETSFTIEKPGLYFGQCSELCGARHAYMPIAVEAVPPEVFARWVRAKGGTMPGSGAMGATPPAPMTPSEAQGAAPGPDAALATNTSQPAPMPATATGN